MDQYTESVKLINNALNKACKKGLFDLDEACLVKNVLMGIGGDINNQKIVEDKLNMSCQNGVFTLDEAYIVKIAMDNIKKHYMEK